MIQFGEPAFLLGKFGALGDERLFELGAELGRLLIGREPGFVQL